MNSLLTGFIIVFGILVLWTIFVCIKVSNRQNKTLKAFKTVDTLLKKRYEFIPDILTNALSNTTEDHSFLEDTKQLYMEVLSLGVNLKTLDRRIALDGELAKNISKIIASLNNTVEVQAINEYNKEYDKILCAKNKYNTLAGKLKTTVEVFPSSLISRFMNVKPLDFIYMI